MQNLAGSNPQAPWDPVLGTPIQWVEEAWESPSNEPLHWFSPRHRVWQPFFFVAGTKQKTTFGVTVKSYCRYVVLRDFCLFPMHWNILVSSAVRSPYHLPVAWVPCLVWAFGGNLAWPLRTPDWCPRRPASLLDQSYRWTICSFWGTFCPPWPVMVPFAGWILAWSLELGGCCFPLRHAFTPSILLDVCLAFKRVCRCIGSTFLSPLDMPQA